MSLRQEPQMYEMREKWEHADPWRLQRPKMDGTGVQSETLERREAHLGGHGLLRVVSWQVANFYRSGVKSAQDIRNIGWDTSSLTDVDQKQRARKNMN